SPLHDEGSLLAHGVVQRLDAPAAFKFIRPKYGRERLLQNMLSLLPLPQCRIGRGEPTPSLGGGVLRCGEGKQVQRALAVAQPRIGMCRNYPRHFAERFVSAAFVGGRLAKLPQDFLIGTVRGGSGICQPGKTLRGKVWSSLLVQRQSL